MNVLKATFTHRDFSALYRYYDDILTNYSKAYKALEKRAKYFASSPSSMEQRQLARLILSKDGLLVVARKARGKETNFRQWVNLQEALELTLQALEDPQNRQVIEEYKRLNKRLDGGVFLNNKVAAAVEIFCGVLVLFATLPIIAFAIVASPPAIIGGVFTAVLGVALIVSGYHSYKSDQQLAKSNQYSALVSSCRLFYRGLKRPENLSQAPMQTQYKMKRA